VNNLQKQLGATLIEVMLVCALSIFLIAGLIQIFLTTKKTFTAQAALAEIQENARFAIHFLQQNIRIAGYAHCDNSDNYLNQKLAIQGYENSLPDFLQGKVMQGTDSIIIGECRSEDGKEKFNQYAFFISPTSRKNILGKTINSLYEMRIDGSKEELVENVSGMKISYGVAAANGEEIKAYLPASQIADWSAVRAVDIALLFSSTAPIFPQSQIISFAGKQLSPDRFLYGEWHVYIALRERL